MWLAPKARSHFLAWGNTPGPAPKYIPSAEGAPHLLEDETLGVPGTDTNESRFQPFAL